MTVLRVVLVGASAVLVLGGCGAQPSPVQLESDQERVHVDPTAAVALPALVTAADALGLDLIVGAGDATTVTSPASLQVTLSMVAEGAEGQTLAELEGLVGAGGAERSDGINALTSTLADLEGTLQLLQEVGALE